MFIADTPYADTLRSHLIRSVQFALEEDLGSGDITAALIPADATAEARVITREAGVLCGREWFDEVLRQVDPAIRPHWQHEDGDDLAPGDVLVELNGPARTLLTAERTALNYLQTLSGTATTARAYARAVAGSGMTLLDTRKTLPGLRLAQKYATRVGGCANHRLGLYDRFLIKENHIAACGGIAAAITAARQLQPAVPVEIEVERLDQLDQALDAGADIVMLDNFDDADTAQALERVASHQGAGATKLESSGNLDLERLQTSGRGGVHADYASIGALTKHLRALDLSLRLEMSNSAG